MATIAMPDPDDRLDSIETELFGAGEEGSEPGLVDLVRGTADTVGVFGVLGNHEKRIAALEPPKAQPRDWFLADNTQTATQWLDELDQWRGRVLNHIKPGLVDVPCWMWHPTAVARLLVLQGLWVSAKRPDQAAVLWTRYLGDIAGSIAGDMKRCKEAGRHRGHDCGHVQKQPDNTVISDWIVDQPTDEAGQDMLRADYLAWWCGSREGIPPGLMPA